MGIQIFKSTCSVHLLWEVLLSVIEPFQVFSFDLERKWLMLFNWSILNLIKLVQLLFENNEISSSLGVYLNNRGLEFLESINNLQKVFVWQEISVIFLLNFGNDCFNREEKSILIEILFQRFMLELLEFIESWILFCDNVLNKSIWLNEPREC